jgi:Tfp pilus assembly PilM family ATPase
MPADEKDSAATNRLLDLLRAQQAGKSTTEGNASGTLEANPPDVKDAGETSRESKPSGISNSIVPEPFVEEKPAEKKPDSVSPAEIKAKLGITEESNPEPPAPEQGDTVTPPESETSTAPTATAEPPESTPLQEEVIPAPDTETSPPEHAVDIPQRIDPAQFKVHKTVQPPNKIIDLAYELSNWAWGIRRKITIQCTGQAVRLMKMQTVGKRNVIHSMEEYRLPYKVGEEIFTHREDLLAHLLDQIDSKLWKKDTMFRMFSSQLETVTKVFKAPPVQGKELDELITWTAKKNLPFSSDNITVDHIHQQTDKGELKKNIVIGVGNAESILHLSNLFKERKFDLQSVTTTPFLDWQTFKHCYPDRQRGCIAIVNVGRERTTITMVKSGRLEFNREMVVGVNDYEKALIQRVMVGNDAVNIDAEMASKYLMEYGIPTDTKLEIEGTGISLYKISIFLRPIIERMTSEINRSLDYFKKEVSDSECQEVYFTGPGAAIPNIVNEFNVKLNRTTEYLNPLRQGDFEFANEFDLDYQKVPLFATNFALALNDSMGINLLPEQRKQHFRYRIFNKLAMFVALILLPMYLILGYLTYTEMGFLEESVVTMNRQWQKLSEQSQEYFVMLDDLEFLGNYWGYLANDRINSENQMKLMRLLSSEIPDNIKLTSVVFRPGTSQESGKAIKQGAHVDRLVLSGIVEAHAGIADIQLTNFIMRLESLNVFTSIEREVRGNPSSDESRLFFTLKLGIDS